MSGGSWDYAYSRVEELGHRMAAENTPHRRALGKHLLLVAKALHDVEWVDSCDYGKGDENAAIEAVIGRGPIVAQIRDEAIALLKLLNQLTEKS